MAKKHNCIELVYVCVWENVYCITADCAYLYQCGDTSRVYSRPLIQVAFHVSFLALYCDNTYFYIILLLMYPNCPRATEARSQCDDIMLHM